MELSLQLIRPVMAEFKPSFVAVVVRMLVVAQSAPAAKRVITAVAPRSQADPQDAVENGTVYPMEARFPTLGTFVAGDHLALEPGAPQKPGNDE